MRTRKIIHTNSRYDENNKRHITENTTSGKSNDSRQGINAMNLFYAEVPLRSDWIALKNHNQRKRNRRYDLESQETVYDDFTQAILEDSRIDQTDGNSYHHERYLVEDSRCEGEDEEGF